MRSRARAVLVVLVAPALLLLTVWAALEAGALAPDRPLGDVMWWQAAAVDDLQVLLVGTAVVGLAVGAVRLLTGHRSAPGKRELAGALTWTWAAGCAAYVVAVVVSGSGPWGPVVAGALAGVVGGLVGAVVVGRAPTSSLVAHGAVPSDAPRASLRVGESAMWSGWTRARWWVYAAELLVAGPGVANTVLLAPEYGLLVVLLVTSIGLYLVATTVRVSVGEAGLVVRSLPLGVPRVVVPLEHVARADVVHVSPIADFGSWGYVPTRLGAVVVTREGPALQVRRGDGSLLTLTVDDAHEAAALLNTLADRRRSRERVAA